MVDTKHFKFDELIARSGHQQHGKFRELYASAAAFDAPTILELGVRRGGSTTLFLTACDQRGGRLASIDLDDCSDVSDSSLWTFIKGSSDDVPNALAKAPFLKDGIDLLYVDAGHTAQAIERDLLAWFPYVRAEGVIFFDDVDGAVHRAGGRKDNWQAEHRLNQMGDWLKALFLANEDTLDYWVRHGSTGQGKLVKHSALGAMPRPAQRQRRRPLHVRLRLALADARAAKSS